MGGLYPSFIFSGGTLTYISFICVFVMGWICSTLFSYIFSLGSSVILLRKVLAETILFVVNVTNEVRDLQELKRYELEKAGKTEKQLELQQRIDNKELRLFKVKIIRTIKSNFPTSFSHMVDFDDWDSLIKNIEKQLKKGD